MSSSEADNPLRGFRVDRASIKTVAHDLHRPECILAERDGTLWTCDSRGSVMEVRPNGTQRLVSRDDESGGGTNRGVPEAIRGQAITKSNPRLPNGIAFHESGDILIADSGIGTIDQLSRDGKLRKRYTEVDGNPIGIVNFVLRDSRNRIWFTVTTRSDIMTAMNKKIADGYIGLIDARGVHIVAEGFAGTNELRFDAKEEWLYVVESFTCRVSRMRVGADGALTHREIYGPSDLGPTPDGFTFDAYGNLWVACAFSDRLLAITPTGDVLTLLDDGVPAQVETLTRHLAAGTATPEMIIGSRGTIAPWFTSVTFGGPDLKTAYIGCGYGTNIPYFRSPVAGLPMVHWNER